ncbi:MAG TPA: Hsp20/alpha crystallin family protein, partial [Candidatus Limnocylindrales bacterium]
RSDTREEKGDYLVQEIRRGELTRSVTLPSGIQADKATAGFEHGVLTLRIPRAEEVKPRRISISATSDGQPASQAPSSNKVGAGSTGES